MIRDIKRDNKEMYQLPTMKEQVHLQTLCQLHIEKITGDATTICVQFFLIIVSHDSTIGLSILRCTNLTFFFFVVNFCLAEIFHLYHKFTHEFLQISIIPSFHVLIILSNFCIYFFSLLD